MSVEETFSAIYRENGWGEGEDRFFSGPGSSGQAADEYCAFAIDFIRRNNFKSVVDLGCGDFAIGKRIIEATGISYTGIDVVPALIEHHQRAYGAPGIAFQCANILTGSLPPAELYLLRQVLQHLSNSEIISALNNLQNCSKALISEHTPIVPRSINRDKPHGPDIRRFYESGVYIDQPPFSIKVQASWEWPLGDDSLLKTYLVDREALQRGASRSIAG